jgi:hypothetical protein
MDADRLNDYIGELIAYLLLSGTLMGVGFCIKRFDIRIKLLKNFNALLWKIPVILSLWFLYIHEMILLTILLEVLTCYLIFIVMIVYTGVLIFFVIRFLRFMNWAED